MRYHIHHLGVPIGSVDLAASELVSAGTLEPAPGYAGIRAVIQEGSAALLRIGFFGAALRRSIDATTDNVPPLRAAAQLVFDLTDIDGNDVPATFVNLLEPPDDDRVVVLARLNHAHSRTPALAPRRPRQESSMEIQEESGEGR